MHARVRVCSFKHRDDQFVNNTIRRFPSFSLPGDSFDPSLISRVVIWTRLAPSTPLSVPFLPLHNLNPSLTCPPLLLLFSFYPSIHSFRSQHASFYHPSAYLSLSSHSFYRSLGPGYPLCPFPDSTLVTSNLLGICYEQGEIRGKVTYLGYSFFCSLSGNSSRCFLFYM